MPQYRFKCDECGQECTEILSVNQERSAKCDQGHDMRRLWDAPTKHRLDFIEGYDIGLDRTFDTQRQRDNYLAENADTVRRVR